MKKVIGVLLLNSLSLLLLGGCVWLGRDFWQNGGKEKYAEIFPTEIDWQNDSIKTIGLQDPIVLSFSVPVDGEKYVSETHLNPPKKAKIKYEGTRQTLTITPLEDWDPETEYHLVLPEGKNKYWAEVKSREFVFHTLNFPQVKKIFPLDNAEDILLDMESPISVELNEPAEEFDLSFALDPAVELAVELDDKNHIFKILPKKPLNSGAQYVLNVSAFLKKNKEKNKQIFESHFKTLPEQSIVWEKDLTLRTAQAKKYTRAKIFSGKYININLASQTMVIFQDGLAVEAFPISSGKRGMETPKGEHRIYNKAERVWSKKYGLYMPFWMAILSDGSVGIHELPEWPGGFKEGAFHLGIPVSHGCVRLGVGAAKLVYDWAEIGTPVIID